MKMLSKWNLLLVAVFSITLCLTAASCDESSDTNDDTDSTPGGDGDTDSDADGDTDADSDSDADTAAYSGVDILFVMDYDNSLTFVTRAMSASIHTLLNTISQNAPGDTGTPTTDIRIGVTTVNLGVSNDGIPYEEEFTTTSGCEGLGMNGAFVAESLNTEIDVSVSQIGCEDNSWCPAAFECDGIDAFGNAVCASPVDADTIGLFDCDISPASQNSSYITVNPDDIAGSALEASCLANHGRDGCGYEQQLGAASKGLLSEPSFIREDSLTVVVVISDKDDCTIGSADWYDVEELSTMEANLACGHHPDMMVSINELQRRYLAAKQAVSGKSGGILFAAVTGVPTTSACQGNGVQIANCLNESLDLGGTVGNPAETLVFLGTQDTPVFAYVCQLNDYTGTSVRHIYPAGRIVQMVQAFGKMGYIYSYCNEDWTPGMKELGNLIKKTQQ